jgi:hypothetical protein
MNMVSECQDPYLKNEQLLTQVNALKLTVPKFKVVPSLLQLAEMRASLQHGDEVVILVRREVIASFSAIKDIVCYITSERNNEKEQAGCFGYLRDTPVITDLALKKNGGSLLCDVVFVSTKDGAIIDVVAANFVGVS